MKTLTHNAAFWLLVAALIIVGAIKIALKPSSLPVTQTTAPQLTTTPPASAQNVTGSFALIGSPVVGQSVTIDITSGMIASLEVGAMDLAIAYDPQALTVLDVNADKHWDKSITIIKDINTQKGIVKFVAVRNVDSAVKSTTILASLTVKPKKPMSTINLNPDSHITVKGSESLINISIPPLNLGVEQR